MLFGREVECERIDHLLGRAREGISGALVLRGEPGIGKSALCAYAVGGAAVLVATRDGEATPFDGAGLPELALRGLDRDASERLLNASGDPAIAPEVAERLIAATGGNPLALREAPTLLSAGQLAGVEPLEEPLPTSEVLEQAFLRRVRALPEETQRALLVAATSGSTDFDVICAAVEHSGVDATALDAAEGAGLLTVERTTLEFQHPLLRAAVYHGATAAARRAAHEAVAQGLASDSRAWHLAAAAPAPDAAVAAEPEKAALAARARGGHAEAAAALEQAARLTAEPEQRARLLRSAADETRRSGQAARALVLLDEALATTTSPKLRSRIQHLRGVVEMWRGAPLAAYEHLTAEAARIEQDDPAKAAWMLTDAGWASFMGGEMTWGRE